MIWRMLLKGLHPVGQEEALWDKGRETVRDLEKGIFLAQR